jgi:putative endonuclease
VEARNYRHGRKEIDLVVRRGDLVAFVEVKSRRSGSCGHPLEAITARKRAEIEEVAAAWIAAFGEPRDSYRFDAVAVRLDGASPDLDHVEDAWRLE